MNTVTRVAMLQVLLVGCGLDDSSTSDISTSVEESDLAADVDPSSCLPCPNFYVCLYDSPNYCGAMQKWQAPVSNLADWGFNDRTSSIINNTDYHWAFYENRNWNGYEFGMFPRTRRPAIVGFDNTISSLQRTP
jgi:hypothetical protein